jgi:putative ABC transport system substrate-binding protein
LGAPAQPLRPVIGFLNSATPELYEFNVAAFRQGLQEAGFVEGRNVAIEFRWARGDYDRLPALAKELVGRGVAAIAATGDVSSARAAQAASISTPFVFTIGGDPVKFGLVDSYNRPGRNLTGISLISSTMGGKRVELLHEIAPNAVIGLFMNPDNPNAALERRDAEAAARSPCTGKPACTSGGSSRARVRPRCRSCSRRTSRW